MDAASQHTITWEARDTSLAQGPHLAAHQNHLREALPLANTQIPHTLEFLIQPVQAEAQAPIIFLKLARWF